MTTADARAAQPTFLCWTCAKDLQCTSDEHRYLAPHAHTQALRVTDLAGHDEHSVTSDVEVPSR